MIEQSESSLDPNPNPTASLYFTSHSDGSARRYLREHYWAMISRALTAGRTRSLADLWCSASAAIG